MNKALFAGVAALGILATSGTAALAEWKPKGPIKLVIAFAAGGGADTQARMIAEDLQKNKGWEVLPEQITGKGGVNALAALKGMPADGTAIAMVVTESIGYNAAAAKGAGLKPSDFTPLTTTAGFQMGIVSKSDKGWVTMNDVVAAAKGGTQIRFGTMSPKLSDLAFLLGEAQGVKFNIVQVKGGKAVLNGVTAGDMDVGFMAGIQGKGVASGDLANLASALSVPLKQTPNAPTLSDLGVKFNADGYFVLVAPAGLPDDARKALSDAIEASATSGKPSGLLRKAFGGATIIKGKDLDMLVQEDFDNAGALMNASK
ncbi:MAG: tripartite tricarboxylate transporter substrate-binding protein [Rhizobiaceae bacterium]